MLHCAVVAVFEDGDEKVEVPLRISSLVRDDGVAVESSSAADRSLYSNCRYSNW
jgi:hypothetical protein